MISLLGACILATSILIAPGSHDVPREQERAEAPLVLEQLVPWALGERELRVAPDTSRVREAELYEPARAGIDATAFAALHPTYVPISVPMGDGDSMATPGCYVWLRSDDSLRPCGTPLSQYIKTSADHYSSWNVREQMRLSILSQLGAWRLMTITVAGISVRLWYTLEVTGVAFALDSK